MVNIAGMGQAADGYLSLFATGNSLAHRVSHATEVTVQLVVSNTQSAVGTLRVQASLDGSNWCNLAYRDSNDIIQDGYAVTAAMLDIHPMLEYPLNANFVRVRWERTSGKGGVSFYIKSRANR